MEKVEKIVNQLGLVPGHTANTINDQTRQVETMGGTKGF